MFEEACIGQVCIQGVFVCGPEGQSLLGSLAALAICCFGWKGQVIGPSKHVQQG